MACENRPAVNENNCQLVMLYDTKRICELLSEIQRNDDCTNSCDTGICFNFDLWIVGQMYCMDSV